MNKIAVIFESKYGATQIYACWIAEALKGEIFRKSEISLSKMKEFDYVIYGAGIYNGKLNGSSFLKKSKRKPDVIFTVGLEQEGSDTFSILEHQLLSAVSNTVRNKQKKVFHFPGAYNPDWLYGIDKLVILFLNGILKKIHPVLQEQENIISLAQPYDLIDKNKIGPFIQYVKDEILHIRK